MEKTCANHPESLALATCKACEKSICLMCVQDEKEGTFCSPKCVQVFREVSDWVGPGNGSVATAAAPAAAPTPAAAQPSGSIFDPEPPSAAAPATAAPAEAESEPAEFEPLVTPGTKWRMIGAVCVTHTDTPAVATCEACDQTVCSLCVVEAENGTFCASCASAKKEPVARAVEAPPPPPQLATAPQPGVRQATRPKGGRGGGGGSPALKIALTLVLLAILGGGGYFVFTSFENATKGRGPLDSSSLTVHPNVDPSPKIGPGPRVDPSPNVDPSPKLDPLPKKVDPPPNVDPSPRIIPSRKVDLLPPPKAPGVVLNPFEKVNPGAWFRTKTEKGGKETYSDLVLKSKEAERYTLSTSTGDVTTTIAPYWVKGEESLELEGEKHLCEIREYETPPLRRWVLLEGQNAGAVLREESADRKMAATRLWENTVRVGRRSIDCLVIEGQLNGAPFKRWFSAGIPVPVKLETAGGRSILVDFGSDPAGRPPLPK